MWFYTLYLKDPSEKSMMPSSHLLLLRHYARKHGTLPSESAAPLLFECDDDDAADIIKKLRRQGHLGPSENGQLMPGPSFEDHAPFSSDKIPAGPAISIAAQEHENINIHAYLISSPNTTVIVPIAGDSMEGAGIVDGDLGIIDLKGDPKPGDIVAAEIDGLFTLKYLEADNEGNYYLAAANPKYKNMEPNATLRIHGVLVGLARRY